MRKSSLASTLTLLSFAIAWATAQPNPPSYISEAPLPKGWPAPGPYNQVSQKKYPAYRAAFASGKFQNLTFWTLFQHIQKNDIPMTAPVEMKMSQQKPDNMQLDRMAFLYQSTQVGKTGADGKKVTVMDVPATKVLSYTWQGQNNEAAQKLAKAELEKSLKTKNLTAKEFRILGYNSPSVPKKKQTFELQAVLK